MNGFFFRNNKHNVSNVSAEWWCNHTLYGKPRASFKHHATFLTVRSPTAVSREPWIEVFYLSSKQFFKKITVKYIIYNEIVLLPLGGGIFYYHGTRQSWLKILDKWVSCYQIVRLLFCLNTKNPKPRDIRIKKLLLFSSYVQLSKIQWNKNISDWPVKCGNKTFFFWNSWMKQKAIHVQPQRCNIIVR